MTNALTLEHPELGRLYATMTFPTSHTNIESWGLTTNAKDPGIYTKESFSNEYRERFVENLVENNVVSVPMQKGQTRLQLSPNFKRLATRAAQSDEAFVSWLQAATGNWKVTPHQQEHYQISSLSTEYAPGGLLSKLQSINQEEKVSKAPTIPPYLPTLRRSPGISR